eukprot:CAMPEP_0182463576 /NCGR_PEP_ID=MMETSP1319-20130603/7717_1 /TAXON_ID=172717 /ORGANISM="Bolidomonas pacifica, Strain RCC208" /LENGTH=146 /DNA_ID=CAMNT_0024663139 /DNA_START=35 /DNA_END=475 /DNA_ORIENTATION=-
MVLGATLAAGTAALLMRRPQAAAAPLKHIGLPRARACPAVIHNNTVYLSGQVPDIPTLSTSDIAEQTRQTLSKIDALLLQCGTDRTRIVSSQVWVKDIERDFEGMNEVWNAWVGDDSQPKGVRACVQSPMAREHILVEIKVIAALP